MFSFWDGHCEGVRQRGSNAPSAMTNPLAREQVDMRCTCDGGAALLWPRRNISVGNRVAVKMAEESYSSKFANRFFDLINSYYSRSLLFPFNFSFTVSKGTWKNRSSIRFLSLLYRFFSNFPPRVKSCVSWNSFNLNSLLSPSVLILQRLIFFIRTPCIRYSIREIYTLTQVLQLFF